MPHRPLGRPPRGSTAWAAQQIERLLDREDQDAKTRARRALLEGAAPFERRDHPRGSTAWAAQQIRLIEQRQARERLNAPTENAAGPTDSGRYRPASLPAPLPSQGLLAPDPTRPETHADNPFLQSVVAPAVPWIIGAAPQIPGWIWGLGALLGLAPLLSGDTAEDDERDFCFRRRAAENARCHRWPERWVAPCKRRARERFMKCYRNGGRPDSTEPPEWGPDDMEEWFNPER